MIGPKRFIRWDLVFSVLGHGCLLLCLLVSAGGVRSVPPEAMTVELVPSEEAPQIENSHVEGTPLDSTSSGSELSSTSEKGSATTTETPRNQTAAPSLQQAQAPLNPQRSEQAAAAQPLTEPPLQDETPQFEPLLPMRTQEATSQPSAGERFAMPLALPGGRVGGGLDAPASNPAMLPHDDTAAFRARVSTCSHLPAGIDQNAAIVLRVSFKRDGTLASSPQLLQASLSPDAALLMHSAVTALERCQPFNELPADKYNEWKTLKLVVTPLALSSGTP